MIKVFGHLAPDTDATCSALIWAWYLSEVKGLPAQAHVLGTPNTEAAFVLGRWGFATPPLLEELSRDEQVVVVDTNNPAELPAGINDALVLEIIDHHLLAGGLMTRQPISITVRPVASTATVMHGLMGSDAARMPEEIRGLMLSCILSDTLEFRSPTTTDTDRSLATELAAGLGIDIPGYAAEMFAAKSDVSHMSDAELLRLDSKKYDVSGTAFRISVLETTSPGTVLARKDSLMHSLETVAREDGVDQVLLFVVDILKEEATLLVPNDLVRRVAASSFGAEAHGDTVVLPGIVSRKKQIIPALAL